MEIEITDDINDRDYDFTDFEPNVCISEEPIIK